jgi:type I restriction enzyme M protein
MPCAVQTASHDSGWFRRDDDGWFFSLYVSNGARAGERRRIDLPPAGNANFDSVQHFIHHLAPQGIASFFLANGSMSSNQSSEGDIRRALIEADLANCMVALPGQLFYRTQIPVWRGLIAEDGAAGVPRAVPELEPALVA